MSGAQGQPNAAASGKTQRHSPAFDSLVQASDDLPGLIAYSIYKQSINERAKLGHFLPQGADRTLSKTEVTTLREAADRRLQDFASAAIAEAQKGIVETGVGLSIATAKAEIVASIARQTSFGMAVLASLVGWIVSIAVTVLILVGASQPNPSDWLKGFVGPKTQTPSPS